MNKMADGFVEKITVKDERNDGIRLSMKCLYEDLGEGSGLPLQREGTGIFLQKGAKGAKGDWEG